MHTPFIAVLLVQHLIISWTGSFPLHQYPAVSVVSPVSLCTSLHFCTLFLQLSYFSFCFFFKTQTKHLLLGCFLSLLPSYVPRGETSIYVSARCWTLEPEIIHKVLGECLSTIAGLMEEVALLAHWFNFGMWRNWLDLIFLFILKSEKLLPFSGHR